MGEKYNKDSQISFMCKNNPGELQSVCDTLNEASINIRAISMTDASDHAVIRMITNDAMKTRIVLDHMGLNTILSPVLIFDVSDYPGALMQITQKLSDASVNIQYLYATTSKYRSRVVLKTDNMDLAEKILKPMRWGSKKVTKTKRPRVSVTQS